MSPSIGSFMRLQRTGGPEWRSSTRLVPQGGLLTWLATRFWLLAGDLSSSPRGPLPRAASVSLHMGAGFLPSERFKRKSKKDPAMTFFIISQVTRHYFCHVLFIRSESLSPVHIKRSPSPFEGRSINFWIYFKTTTSYVLFLLDLGSLLFLLKVVLQMFPMLEGKM